MKDKQYLKEHEAEALKKIAEAMGKEQVCIIELPHSWSEKSVRYLGEYGMVEFNPLTNADQ